MDTSKSASDQLHVGKNYLVLNLLSTLLIVPALAKLNGRVPLPITKSSNLIPHNYTTPLLNRHYVKPKLRDQLYKVANETNFENKKLKLSYLDAIFPFIEHYRKFEHSYFKFPFSQKNKQHQK